MAAIAPFRALRYADADMAAVTSPPHDVLRSGEREALCAREAHNVVRLILGDGDGDDRYDRAADLLRRWVEEGVLVRDDRPALYWYTITHGPPTERATMHGLFCRLRLDPTGTQVKPHERTHARRAGDRRRLLEATACNTEPIWLLYRDERGWVDEVMSSNAMEELSRFTDEEGSEHRLWRVDRPEAVGEVVAQFDGRELVIADGHHRYQTALDLYAATGRPEHGSILVCLVRDTDPGARIEPTHRIVAGASLDDALAAAAANWDAVPLDAATPESIAAAVGRDDRACALVMAGHAWLLRLKDGHGVDQGRGTVDALAVTRVHELLLKPLGIAGDAEHRLRYTQRHDDAVAASGDALVVILPPEPVHAVLDVAREGQLMPQKATYFVPKLRSGIVMGPLDEPIPVPWSEQAGDAGPMDFRRPPL